jgi:hypothetical protein
MFNHNETQRLNNEAVLLYVCIMEPTDVAIDDTDDEDQETVFAEEPKFDLEALVPKETSFEEILNPNAHVGWKPDVSNLQDAVIDGKLVVERGGKLLIEYFDTPWRDTTVWVIVAIEPKDTITSPGYVRLWDPNKMHYGSTNYLTGQRDGLVFKVPDKSRRWVPNEDDSIEDQLKRRRHKAKEETPSTTSVVPSGKKLGRPKGSKTGSSLARKEALQK